MSFCVIMIRPGTPFPDCITGSFIAVDNHDACRQAEAAFQRELATFFYRAEFFYGPAMGKGAVAGDRSRWWPVLGSWLTFLTPHCPHTWAFWGQKWQP